MHKLWLIVKREYTSRVTGRAFLIGTFLMPLGLTAIIALNVKLAVYKDDHKKRIAVVDPSHLFDTYKLKKSINLELIPVDAPVDSLIAASHHAQYDGFIIIPPIADFKTEKLTVSYYSDEKLNYDVKTDLMNAIREKLRDYKIKALDIDTVKLNALDTRITIEPNPITGGKKSSSISGDVAMGIGMIMGFFMYFAVVFFSVMTFRSVMEEKTSRIVEVIISSVKPFQLMMGKILGVGAVGLTQFLIQIVLIIGLAVGLKTFMHVTPPSVSPVSADPMMAQSMKNLQNVDSFTTVLYEIQHQNWLMIIPVFLLFFILGYILYASLFAAMGSAVGDDAGEAQSLTFPIMIPIIIAIYLMTTAVRSPQSSLAFWSSIIPFFSPIVMPALLPFNPPAWQIGLSLVLLICTVFLLVWLAGRIYRIGILMYGQKIKMKDMLKWMFRSDI